MKRKNILFTLIAIFLLPVILFLISEVMGRPASSAEMVDPEWVELFNGKDLNGWTVKCLPQDQGKSYWKVVDKAIECNSLGDPDHDYIWLCTDEEYKDFRLHVIFQVFRESKGNSGIQFRSRYDTSEAAPSGGWLNGPQVDIHPPAPFRTGLIYDETADVNRWIYPSLPDWNINMEQAPPAARKISLVYYEDDPTAFNTLELICKGMDITTHVNGVNQNYNAEGILNDPVHTRLQVGEKGVIALQLHKNDELRIRFLKILLKED